MLEEKRNYAVTTKCGHVKTEYYIPITFAIEASSGVEAAAIARGIGRVKHHHKDAILQVREVSRREYMEIIQRNQKDPYLMCKNVQEQNTIIDEIKERLVPDSNNKKKKYSKQERRERVEFKMKKQKIILDELLEYSNSYACGA